MDVPPGAPWELAYERVANDIAARIASGELPPGTQLKAQTDLAADYGVAYGTIRRAILVLRQRKLIVAVHGRGTFVSASPDADTQQPNHCEVTGGGGTTTLAVAASDGSRHSAAPLALQACEGLERAVLDNV